MAVAEEVKSDPVIEVAEQKLPAPPSALTPMELLNRALERGTDLQMLEKLMELQDRHEKKEARKAFDEALAEAKASFAPIRKNRTGNNNAKYADFSAFAAAIDNVLAEHGLSYRFRTRQDDRIHVTCIIAHRMGHIEENTLSGTADKTGNKSDIQALGSTLTYLQRYSLAGALGLAASDDDDATSASAGQQINAEQLGRVRDLIDQTETDIELFCKHLNIEALPDMPTSKYDGAIKALLAKKLKRESAKSEGGK